MLATEVPYGSEFERMAARRAPIESYAPASAAAEIYRALWREIDERLDVAVERARRVEQPERADRPAGAARGRRRVGSRRQPVVGRAR